MTIATLDKTILISGASKLSASANAAVKGGIEELKAEGDLKASIGAGCALGQLEAVASILGSIGGDLNAQVSASVEVTGAVGG